MTQGYCIHAYNNLEINYGTMALCAALLIKKNCKINQVCLITTEDTINELHRQHSKTLIDAAFDHIQIIEIDRNVFERKYYDTRYSVKSQPYYNLNRFDIFTLSPFDETILLDSDYLVLDNTLDYAWGNTEDIMVNKVVRDLRHKIDTRGFDLRFNEMGIPLYWATCLYFKKTNRAKTLFRLISFIKENYGYYQSLYNFRPNAYFRNDYALSIALHMLSGQLELDSVKPLPIPYLLMSTDYDDLVKFKDNTAYFISEAEEGNFGLHKISTNVHVMNKWSIGRNAESIISYATTK